MTVIFLYDILLTIMIRSKEIKIRRSWKINPQVRVKESFKVYSRKRNKHGRQREKSEEKG